MEHFQQLRFQEINEFVKYVVLIVLIVLAIVKTVSNVHRINIYIKENVFHNVQGYYIKTNV